MLKFFCAFFSSFFITIPVWAFSSSNGAPSTQAGYCTDCVNNGRGLRSIDTGMARSSYAPSSHARDCQQSRGRELGGSGSARGTVGHAVERFKNAATKHGQQCLNKNYIIINNLSRGSSDNMSYILKRTPSGQYQIADCFPTGQGSGSGSGVGNVAGSNNSPTGLMRLSGFGMYQGRMEGGRWYTWPTFTSRQGRRFNYIITSGLEPKNRNISSRSTVFHPITYSTGATTNGCTGIPRDRFYNWASSLEDSCAYGYDGS